MKKTWKTRGQNMHKHPTVVVTTSTGKAAINVNGTTLHSAFGLPVREGITFTQLARDKENNFQKKYVNLKALLVDEISVISKLTFNDLNVDMRKVFDEDGILNLDFGRKFMLLIGDFLQLPSSDWMIFEYSTPTDSNPTCSNYTNLLRLSIKIVIPNLQNY